MAPVGCTKSNKNIGMNNRAGMGVQAVGYPDPSGMPPMTCKDNAKSNIAAMPMSNFRLRIEGSINAYCFQIDLTLNLVRLKAPRQKVVKDFRVLRNAMAKRTGVKPLTVQRIRSAANQGHP